MKNLQEMFQTKTEGTEQKPSEMETIIESLIPDNPSKEKNLTELLNYELIIAEVLKGVIPEYWINKKFEDLQYPDNIAEKIKEIRDWDFSNPISITILSKNNGVGKTHIAVCILKQFVKNRIKEEVDKQLVYNPDLLYGDLRSVLNTLKNSRYFEWEGNIYERIINSFNGSTESKDSIIEELKKRRFLVIDDLFSVKSNEFARDVMLSIIHNRIDWERKPTVITSNLTSQEIKKIDTRIYSRLTNGIVLEIESYDTDMRGKQ